MALVLPPSLSEAVEVLNAQPFSRLLGAEITAFEPGLAVLQLPFRRDLCQQNGYLHGGVLAYLADNAVTFAAGSVLGPHMLTASVALDYLRPVTGDVECVARVISTSGRVASCRAELTCAGQICSVAHGTARLAGR